MLSSLLFGGLSSKLFGAMHAIMDSFYRGDLAIAAEDNNRRLVVVTCPDYVVGFLRLRARKAVLPHF
jgi:hypothetical protein